jgi:hypothetical protein
MLICIVLILLRPVYIVAGAAAAHRLTEGNDA